MHSRSGDTTLTDACNRAASYARHYKRRFRVVIGGPNAKRWGHISEFSTFRVEPAKVRCSGLEVYATL